MDSIAINLQELSHTIAGLSAPNRPVTLIAVSKMQDASRVALAAQAGHLDFGENYVQEGVEKIQCLKTQFPALVWHMIGPLQSNKTRAVASHFDWVHTVDRYKIAQRLSEQRPGALADLNVLIQVNIDREASKSGVMPDDLTALAQQVSALPRLKLRGLMCIPEKNSAHAFSLMPAFIKQLQQIGALEQTNTGQDSLPLALSMGMSADYASAIAHGATHVRVGTAIFGPRTATKV